MRWFGLRDCLRLTLAIFCRRCCCCCCWSRGLWGAMELLSPSVCESVRGRSRWVGSSACVRAIVCAAAGEGLVCRSMRSASRALSPSARSLPSTDGSRRDFCDSLSLARVCGRVDSMNRRPRGTRRTARRATPRTANAAVTRHRVMAASLSLCVTPLCLLLCASGQS